MTNSCSTPCFCWNILQVVMARPGSLASLRFVDQQADGASASESADIGQPDSLHPRDTVKGAVSSGASASALCIQPQCPTLLASTGC